jgi:hypothetical protein
LTITSLMALRDRGDPLPAAAACLSPVADLSDRGNPSKEFNDPLLPPRAVKIYKSSYVAHNDARDPLISPVFGDWHGLPPLLDHAGEDEILREDAVRIEELAKAAKRALLKGDIATIGSLMNQNHKMLQQIAVSGEIIDELVEIALKSGAIGAKLTGTGRGGLVIGLAENADIQGKIVNVIEERGYRAWGTTIG